jgi:hypothetical protein
VNNASRKLLSAFVLALAACTAAAVSAAPVDCKNPGTKNEARGCKAAAQGIAELRFFIWRSRFNDQFRMVDFDGWVPPYE